MKKRITSLVVALALVLACVFSLSGCVLAAGPITLISGTYEFELLGTTTTYEFSPLGKVTLTVDALIADETYEGSYKIDGDKITFTFENNDTLSGESDFSYGEKEGVSYVKIGLVTYNEVK